MNHRDGRCVKTGAGVHVEWSGDRVSASSAISAHEAHDWISPGWIDLQINGLAGVHFGDPQLQTDDVRLAVQQLWAGGVVHFLPTLITDSFDRTTAALKQLSVARQESDLAFSILGFHLEGPYLSPEDGPRGAHPLEHCRLPDWDEFRRFQDSAAGGVRLVTLAPELPGALHLIEKLTDAGVRTAIGHTAASRVQILAAIEAGATLATHLGNAAHPMVDRHRNYIFDQLGDDRLCATIIADGHHLPANVVKIFVRAKTPARTILVSDAVHLAGLPPGVYDAGYRQFEVRADGYVGVWGEPRMAGSGVLLRPGIENVLRFSEVTLMEALAMVTSQPAKLLGLEDQLGSLASGREASMVRFRFDEASCAITVLETIVGGRTVYSHSSSPL